MLAIQYDAEYFKTRIGGFHAASFPIISKQFMNIPLPRPIPRVLDLGCGNGFYSPLLRSQVTTLHGADSSKALLADRARSNYENFYCTDLGRPWKPPQDNYDLVFSVEVVEHVADYRTFLKNAYDSLKPGGTLFLTTTTFYPALFTLLIIYRRRVTLRALLHYVRGCLGDETAKTQLLANIWEYTVGHYHGFSRRELKRGLRESGFVNIHCRSLHIEPVVPVRYFSTPYGGRHPRLVHYCIPLLRTLGRLVNVVCRRTNVTSSNIVAVATKRAS